MPAYQAIVDRDIQPRHRLLENLKPDLQLTVGGPDEEGELVDALDETDVLITTSRLRLSARVFEATDLELIGKIGTGVDNIDTAAARSNGVTVTYTPGLNAQSVAEHTVGLLLSVSHRIGAAQDLLLSGRWRDEAELGSTVSGKTVGLVGYGNVGRRIAKLLSGFEVDVLAYDPYVRDIDGEITGAEIVEFDRILTESDIVCVTAELTDETRGLLGASELATMKQSALLVNTARGEIVDTDAVVDALHSDELGGAGLDVFETEPLPPDAPILDCENVVATPHTAAMTQEYRVQAVDVLSENVLSLLGGKPVGDEYMLVWPDS